MCIITSYVNRAMCTLEGAARQKGMGGISPQLPRLQIFLARAPRPRRPAQPRRPPDAHHPRGRHAAILHLACPRVRGVPEWGHRLVWDTVLWGTLRNQGLCKFVRALVWREVARVVVDAEDAVRCASVRREGSMKELTICRSFILLNQLYHYVN